MAVKPAVGVFMPPSPDGTQPARPAASLDLGKIPPDAHATLRRRLDGLADEADVVHDLDLRRSFILDGRVRCGDRCASDLDVYVWYAEMERALGGYHLEVLKTLGTEVLVVPDPWRFEQGLDKFWAHQTLGRAGVRVPETVLVDHRNLDLVEALLDAWGRAVLKPRWGSFGQGVLLVEDFAGARDAIGFLGRTSPCAVRQAFLLERFYPNDPADWVSAVLINGELMYGYRKRASARVALGPHGAWKVFDADGVGGHVDLAEVSPAHLAQARRAQRALDAPVVGFDMILHQGVPVVVDENTFPGLYPRLFAEAGKDLGEELFRMVLGALRRYRGA
ncbi:RimK family alpha-L-glutamate ligase [Streptomyces sp. NPDC018031]|uniref:RimK family alpha-L-glutamate ligase n=1 Tax=Streptomyces sp. NPDC018031 TaxID=3365033 RepID=UPI0037A2FC39